MGSYSSEIIDRAFIQVEDSIDLFCCFNEMKGRVFQQVKGLNSSGMSVKKLEEMKLWVEEQNNKLNDFFAEIRIEDINDDMITHKLELK